MKLYSALYGDAGPFEVLFDRGVRVTEPHDLQPDGALILWGGEDISPSIYGDTRLGLHTRASMHKSERDRREVEFAHVAMEMGMPIIGICRGAQLMCALTGGNIIQHVAGHTSQHMMTTVDGRQIITSSLHHQMLYPWSVEHEMLAWAEGISPIHLDQDDCEWEFPAKAYTPSGILKEPEIVYFPKSKCLAFQGHPEFMNIQTNYVQYCLQLVEERLVPHI